MSALTREKTIVIVTKDIGEFNVFAPVARKLQNLDHRVRIIAEGLSMQKWLDAGFGIYGGLPPEGKFDPNTKVRHDLEPVKVLEALKPDVVLVGFPSPNHLGAMFGEAAVSMGIKLGGVEDLWGVSSRMKTIPNFICTPDSFGLGMVQKNYGFDAKCGLHVTGSPAMDALATLEPTMLVQSMLGSIGYPIVLFTGQDASTTPAIRGLVEALEKGGPYVLIPRFHPKWMGDETKAEHRDEWLRALGRVKKGFILQVPAEAASTEQLMLSSHVVVSIYSTTLWQAALLGKVAVSWNSPIGEEQMAASLGGVKQFPVVSHGAAIEVRSPEEFAKVPIRFASTAYQSFVSSAKEKLQADFKATERVVAAILKELE